MLGGEDKEGNKKILVIEMKQWTSDCLYITKYGKLAYDYKTKTKICGSPFEQVYKYCKSFAENNDNVYIGENKDKAKKGKIELIPMVWLCNYQFEKPNKKDIDEKILEWKNSKKLAIISIVSNPFICFLGVWLFAVLTENIFVKRFLFTDYEPGELGLKNNLMLWMKMWNLSCMNNGSNLLCNGGELAL